ncbi:hypothetical protein [Telluribacter humicola]|uniref:hypothetical protein n=1 Tax=Telluribacter humicola TaxID=1720261 RepID=UPI001A95935F|nr:hypothetical protein [Telluribacter humicola]
MKNLYQYIEELTIDKWHYYYGIDNDLEAIKPFIDHIDYLKFILDYFKKGGKVRIFELSDINPDELRLPNHICSVFFLGIILYNETELLKTYKFESSDVGYSTFPFIWFLIALFHDNAYQMEDKSQLQNISSISDLVKMFNIEHSLLDRKFTKCKSLLNSRNNYFLFRKKEWKVVDHGILGGMLLFDRLVKIRREKKRMNEDSLFWGNKLEKHYETAANAISIHNIWLQSESICNEFNLKELLNFKPIKFKEFPLFYLLGIIDTIEPLKTYKDDNLSDIEILKSINLELKGKHMRVTESDNSKIDFRKLIRKVVDLAGWLDVKIEIEHKGFKVTFR